MGRGWGDRGWGAWRAPPLPAAATWRLAPQLFPPAGPRPAAFAESKNPYKVQVLSSSVLSVCTYIFMSIYSFKIIEHSDFLFLFFLVQNSLKAGLLSCREPSDHLHRKADPPVSFARDVTCVAARAVRVASWEHWNRRRVALSGLRLPALVSAESFHHTGTSKPCQPSLSVAVSALPVINDFSSQFMSSQETARAPEPLPGALPGSARAPAVQMEFDSQG